MHALVERRRHPFPRPGDFTDHLSAAARPPVTPGCCAAGHKATTMGRRPLRRRSEFLRPAAVPSPVPFVGRADRGNILFARAGQRAAGWHFSSVDNRRRRRPADGGMPAVAVCASNVCGLPANGVRSRRGRDIVLFSRFPRSFTLSSFAKLSSTAERVGLHGPTHNYYHYTDR